MIVEGDGSVDETTVVGLVIEVTKAVNYTEPWHETCTFILIFPLPNFYLLIIIINSRIIYQC